MRDLLINIKDTSASTNAAKGTILATPNLRNNFANAVAHLTTMLQLGQSLQQDNQNISATQTGGAGGRVYQDGRNNRRGRGGRGGRGRGRGRNVYLGSYIREQWNKLSAEDKKRCMRDGRNQLKNPNPKIRDKCWLQEL